jgi:acetyl esterase/lipase
MDRSSIGIRGAQMIKYLAFALALALSAASAQMIRPGALPLTSNVVRVGLDDAPMQPVSIEELCKDVSFTRTVKYGADDANVLDVATTENKTGELRPVLIFVAGQHFASDDESSANQVEDEAMCQAAHHGMVGVHVKYRLAPANAWPAGARDVSAAISWVHQNADLFKGDAQTIIAVGWSVGAFHLATYLAHPEFQEADNYIAGTVLVSGIYRADAEIGDGAKSYFGADASKYDERSAFPGILKIEDPIVLAWSTDDPPHLVAQAEKLKDSLCKAGHCPRIAVLKDRDSPASVFGLDGTGESLADRTQQLLSQIQARGLP